MTSLRPTPMATPVSSPVPEEPHRTDVNNAPRSITTRSITERVGDRLPNYRHAGYYAFPVHQQPPSPAHFDAAVTDRRLALPSSILPYSTPSAPPLIEHDTGVVFANRHLSDDVFLNTSVTRPPALRSTTAPEMVETIAFYARRTSGSSDPILNTPHASGVSISRNQYYPLDRSDRHAMHASSSRPIRSPPDHIPTNWFDDKQRSNPEQHEQTSPGYMQEYGPLKQESGESNWHPVRVRVSQACQPCRHRKAKCCGSKPKCERCNVRGLSCVYSEVRNIRGPKGGRRHLVHIPAFDARSDVGKTSAISDPGIEGPSIVPPSTSALRMGSPNGSGVTSVRLPLRQYGPRIRQGHHREHSGGSQYGHHPPRAYYTSDHAGVFHPTYDTEYPRAPYYSSHRGAPAYLTSGQYSVRSLETFYPSMGAMHPSRSLPSHELRRHGWDHRERHVLGGGSRTSLRERSHRRSHSSEESLSSEVSNDSTLSAERSRSRSRPPERPHGGQRSSSGRASHNSRKRHVQKRRAGSLVSEYNGARDDNEGDGMSESRRREGHGHSKRAKRVSLHRSESVDTDSLEPIVDDETGPHDERRALASSSSRPCHSVLYPNTHIGFSSSCGQLPDHIPLSPYSYDPSFGSSTPSGVERTNLFILGRPGFPSRRRSDSMPGMHVHGYARGRGSLVPPVASVSSFPMPVGSSSVTLNVRGVENQHSPNGALDVQKNFNFRGARKKILARNMAGDGERTFEAPGADMGSPSSISVIEEREEEDGDMQIVKPEKAEEDITVENAVPSAVRTPAEARMDRAQSTSQDDEEAKEASSNLKMTVKLKLNDHGVGQCSACGQTLPKDSQGSTD